MIVERQSLVFTPQSRVYEAAVNATRYAEPRSCKGKRSSTIDVSWRAV